MQRIPRLSLALLSTLAASSTALAGPLSLNPPKQRSTPPSIASIYGAPPAEAAQPVRPAPVRNEYGGGFFEFLFRGPSGGRYEPSRESGYRQYPQAPGGDLGPGMVESPYHPGTPAMDPRYLKQEVSYDGSEGAGTIVINTR